MHEEPNHQLELDADEQEAAFERLVRLTMLSVSIDPARTDLFVGIVVRAAGCPQAIARELAARGFSRLQGDDLLAYAFVLIEALCRLGLVGYTVERRSASRNTTGAHRRN